MYKRWLAQAVLGLTVAISVSGSSTVETTCADLKNSVQKFSSKLAPEIQACRPYIVTKCCDEEGGCTPSNGFDQCYLDCVASLEASGDEQLKKCSKSRRSLFVKRRLRRRKHKKKGRANG